MPPVYKEEYSRESLSQKNHLKNCRVGMIKRRWDATQKSTNKRTSQSQSVFNQSRQPIIRDLTSEVHMPKRRHSSYHATSMPSEAVRRSSLCESILA